MDKETAVLLTLIEEKDERFQVMAELNKEIKEQATKRLEEKDELLKEKDNRVGILADRNKENKEQSYLSAVQKFTIEEEEHS